MDSIQDWYRYVDEVSRPARRAAGDPSASGTTWRPWLGRAAEDELDEVLPSGSLPNLPNSIGGLEMLASLMPATREFEDPTVYDELDPIPEFHVPVFQAPGFEVQLPTLAPPANQDTAAASDDEAGEELDLLPELELSDCESAEPDEGAPASTVSQEQRRELLAQLRQQIASDEPRSEKTSEARQKLVERLDPTLTLEETAELLEVCLATVRRYTNRGQLKHFRTPGNQRRFRLSDVLEFRASRMAGGEGGN